MRRLMCAGCGLAEDLDNPTGTIHTMQFVDLSPTYSTPGGVDQTAQEDLCGRCRSRIRAEFFGIEDSKLLEMPFMKTG